MLKGQNPDFSWYDDNHILNYVAAVIAELGGYREGSEYLLQGNHSGCFVDIQDKQSYWVAITSAVDTCQLALPLDYFLDKSHQPVSMLATILEELLPYLTRLSTLENEVLERQLVNYLAHHTDDAKTIAFVIHDLRAADFNAALLEERIEELKQRTLRRDVFDEIMPLLISSRQGRVKILFPYNQTQNHWLTGEIHIDKNEDNYCITLVAHDPYGGGQFLEHNELCLRHAIAKRIREEDKVAQAITFHVQTSPYTTHRQAPDDGVSCGVIVADELIKRLHGAALDRDTPYSPKDMAALRQAQARCVQGSHQIQRSPLTTKSSKLLEGWDIVTTTSAVLSKRNVISNSEISEAVEPEPLDALPPLIGDFEDAELLAALRAYYCSQNTFLQGLSHRKQSITQSYINLSIIEVEKQKQKEQGLDDNKSDSDAPEKERETRDKAEPHSRDERLASYEDLHAVTKPIALEDIFTPKDKTASSPRRLLVVGRAGIGKTIFSLRIANDWGRGNLLQLFKAVFRLSLRNLDQPQYQDDDQLTLAEFILRECFPEATPFTAQYIAYLLTHDAEQVLLLLDGYDEVAHLVNAKTRVGEILREALAFVNILLTSRPYPAPTDIPFDRRLENMGFTNENIEAYVTQYFNHPEVLRPEQATQLLQFLKANPNIWGTAHVPINVALICNAWEQALAEGKSLNARLQMTGLYQTLVRDLLKRSLERRGEPTYGQNPRWIEEQCQNATHLLEALAMRGLEAHQLILTPQLQHEILEQLQQDDSNQHFEEAVSLGILQTVGHAKGDVIDTPHYFIHLTFQEFFAARYQVRGLHQPTDSAEHQAAIQFIREHKYTPRYQIVFWFMAGLLSAGQETRPLIIFWNTLLSEPMDCVGIAHLRLLLRCLDEAYCDARIPQRDLLLEHIGQTLGVVVGAASTWEYTGIFGMGWDWKVKNNKVFESLLPLLQQCPHVWQQPGVLEPLIRMAHQDKDAESRQRSIEVLGQILNLKPGIISVFYERGKPRCKP